MFRGVSFSSSIILIYVYFLFSFFFNDTATTEIYTLSLHDALPIFRVRRVDDRGPDHGAEGRARFERRRRDRSEEHTSELQSLTNLVCRLLLEKKKKKKRKKRRTNNEKHHRKDN